MLPVSEFLAAITVHKSLHASVVQNRTHCAKVIFAQKFNWQQWKSPGTTS